MRENRTHGSEGGGSGTTGPSYPYRDKLHTRNTRKKDKPEEDTKNTNRESAGIEALFGDGQTQGRARHAVALRNQSRVGARMADQPNILFICTDQQFADAMSCVGNDNLSTPGMDRIAAAGTRFDRAYCTHPLCVPARASFMTG